MRYEVIRANGESEGLLADEWEIHPSGALLFYSSTQSQYTAQVVNRKGFPDPVGKLGLRIFEMAFAPGAWASFYGADA